MFERALLYTALATTLGCAEPPEAAAVAHCATPAEAVRIAPGTPIQETIERHPPGTSFLLEAGVHALQRVEPRDGDGFYGDRDATCERLTTLRGARRLVRFRQAGDYFAADYDPPDAERNGFCLPGFPRCDRAEEAFLDDRRLHRVAVREELAPGRWFLDEQSRSVVLADSPIGRRVEISETRFAFASRARDVRIEGLVVEKYANPAQMGAIGERGPGPGWRVVDNEIRHNHGAGVSVTDGGIIQNNAILHNGQLGATADGSGVAVRGNEIAFNNTSGFDASWEAGGAKFAATRELTLERNCVHHNRGPGLWVDVDARGTRFLRNTVFENDGEGIFVEISRNAEIRQNRLGRNGRGGRWLYGANVLISGSRNTHTAGNFIEVAPDYGHGVMIIWQEREDAFAPAGHRVEDNEIVFSGPVGHQGSATDFDAGTQRLATNVAFANNRYRMSRPETARFEWNDRLLPLSALQELGQEEGSRVLPRRVPVAWSCPAD